MSLSYLLSIYPFLSFFPTPTYFTFSDFLLQYQSPIQQLPITHSLLTNTISPFPSLPFIYIDILLPPLFTFLPVLPFLSFISFNFFPLYCLLFCLISIPLSLILTISFLLSFPPFTQAPHFLFPPIPYSTANGSSLPFPSPP